MFDAITLIEIHNIPLMADGVVVLIPSLIRREGR